MDAYLSTFIPTGEWGRAMSEPCHSPCIHLLTSSLHIQQHVCVSLYPHGKLQCWSKHRQCLGMDSLSSDRLCLFPKELRSAPHPVPSMVVGSSNALSSVGHFLYSISGFSNDLYDWHLRIFQRACSNWVYLWGTMWHFNTYQYTTYSDRSEGFACPSLQIFIISSYWPYLKSIPVATLKFAIHYCQPGWGL
jgi:hypothetical protein